MALPATRREVVQPALPDPRSAEFAVHEQEGLPARPALGQPRLDVQAPLGQLDLVLADRAAAVGLAGPRQSGAVEAPVAEFGLVAQSITIRAG